MYRCTPTRSENYQDLPIGGCAAMYRYTSARSENYQDLLIGGCTATYRYNPESGISQPDSNENPSVCVTHTPVESFVKCARHL
eukprot:SAG11_NODE_3239_length_2589_cov_5.581124_1_plen_83_part_00